jgi:hypothetical protein
MKSKDGAPPHTSNATQRFLAEKLSPGGFWEKTMWPPSSPDLNPLDFSIWSRVESEACRTSHPNVAALMASVSKVWQKIPIEDFQKACGAFRGRVERCIAAEGDYFE